MEKMNRQKIRKLVCLALAFMMALSLAACGGGGGSSTPPAGSTGGDAPASTPAGDPSEAKGAQDLVLATYSDGHCYMDPHKTTSYFDYQVLNQTGDTLVTQDFDGATIVPGLADSWEVSDDGLTYTFHLKQNVKFHSGKAMTSADVKYTYDRWGAEETASQTRSFVSRVDSIECPDDYTVVFNMSQPDNNFLVNLTVPVAIILNEDAVKAAEDAGQVYGTESHDGTGPFIFEEFIQSDSVRLVRNDEYAWGPACFENKGAAHLDSITWRFLPEPGTRLMEFRAGNVHILGNGSLLASELESVLASGDFRAEYFNPPYPVFIQFQLDHVTDINVRRACNMAVDREEITNTVMAGIADPMVGALPSHYKWYWDGADNYYPYDREAAGQLLEDSGYKLESDGFRYKDGEKLTIDIMFCSSDEDKMTAELFQAQMLEIGVDITVNTAMVSNFWSHINTNEFDTLIMGLYINSPEDMLYEYMSTNNLPFPNRQGFSDPEVDELLGKALSTADEAERQACYDRVQEIAMEQAMWVPLYNRNSFIPVSNKVQGLRCHPTIVEGEPKMLDVYIDDTK
ncbi:ABC transporter substrate-binding protein [Ruminococcaceae bacterium OttesenSCG-928-D13]|nr:ABC transporter substrate-binding protein [Ruminococcaceae bacterium OttesenSCG-928-D13]